MKKIISFALTAVILFSLTACSSKISFKYVDDDILKEEYTYLNEKSFHKEDNTEGIVLQCYRNEKTFGDFPYYIPKEEMFTEGEEKENVKFVLGESITPEQKRYVKQYENEKGFYWVQYPNNFKAFYMELDNIPYASSVGHEKALEKCVEYLKNLNVELNSQYVYTVKEVLDLNGVTAEKIDFRRKIDGYSFFRGNEYIPWYVVLKGDKVQTLSFFDTPYEKTDMTIKRPSKTYEDVANKVYEDINDIIQNDMSSTTVKIYIEPCYSYLENKKETVPAYAIYMDGFDTLIKLYNANDLTEISSDENIKAG